MKTERVVILVTPEEAKQIAKKAKTMGVSVGEYTRRAIDAYATGEEAAEFAVLCKELHETVERAKASMKRLGYKQANKAKELARVD
jgi:ATP-dependent RNA circularization protein (DNA/RNA ligase family)